MTFISYAQNFEDVMLWRALKYVSNGFYIDVGAAWPEEHSVTKAFYDAGWHGINIEPNAGFNEALRISRIRDINLRVAIGERDGVLEMNVVSGTGLSTLDDAIAAKHLASGWTTHREQVEVRRLSTIWREHVPIGQEVHFLKIDVEGFEEAALRGGDWGWCRPWVVVVEATLPMSQEESHDSWESILIEAKYIFAYADGLNRFYVAQEHADLVAAFKYPPNVFDGFKLQLHQEAEAIAVQAEAKAQRAEAMAAQAEANAQQAEIRAQQAEIRAQQAEIRAQQAEIRAQQAEAKAQQEANHSIGVLNELHDIYASKSWRLTVPLRWVVHQSRLIRTYGLSYRLGAANKKLIFSMMRLAARYPVLKLILVRLASILGVADRLKRFYRSAVVIPFAGKASVVQINESSMTPRARQIYQDLIRAIESGKG